MMSGSKPTPSSLFFLIILSFKLSYGLICLEIEKEALLSFKRSLQDPSNLLSSWNVTHQTNCCKWRGVVCSNFTGHVHQLHLQGYDLRGKLSPSLLNLKHLRYLDLSLNNFNKTIPSFIGLLTSLQYLNLSRAGFHGIIPHTIGNISNLHTLSFDDDNFILNVDGLEWLSGLSRLEHLNMNYVNLGRASNWVHVINTLPSLVELHFRFCSLTFMAPASPNDHVNMTSLKYLDLSNNNFRSLPIPRWIFQLSNLIFLDISCNYFEGLIPTISNTAKLQHLDLSYNSLNSTIPDWLYFCKDLEFGSFASSNLNGTISNSISNLTSLITLDLSGNQISGQIPREISNLCKMQKLDLSDNKLQGEISYSFGNMSDCFLGSLEYLNLATNQLSGHLTDQFVEFKSLQSLILTTNSLSGAIPTNLGKLSPSLKYLYLDGSKLTGNLPKSLGQLLNLETLFIEDNMLEGVVTESHFVNLTKLKYLYASGNHLTLRVSPNWIPPFTLEHLRVGSWNLGIDFGIPSWLETQKGIITTLDLSNTGISGNVPSWFWDIQVLDLSYNLLHGEIADTYGTRSLYLGSNRFSGSLPRAAPILEELDLSNNSFSGGVTHFFCDMRAETHSSAIIHLGGNHLTGDIPNCWTKWPRLTYLNLGNNNMSGRIPNSMGFLANLRSLSLNNNKFSGQIPFPLSNCSRLVNINLASNNHDGSIPTWIGTSLADLRILILRSNELSGEISLDICRLNSLQILDLSDNKLSGVIPKCVDNFTAMATKRKLTDKYSKGGLDYSSVNIYGDFLESASVATKGIELQYDTILLLVTNIDLSRNNLSGDIPKELTHLVELRSLNLSGNHFTGLIPDSIREMRQLESLDFSRNSLSGEIPNGFTTMSTLNYLNLSYNHLTGRIPQSTQILGLNASSFIGNNLCGYPLPVNCRNDDEDEFPRKGEDDGDELSNIEWFYVFLSLGYAVGLSAVCTTLVLKKSWRDAYFGWLENMWDKVRVYFHIVWRRLKETSDPSLLE